MNRQPPAYYESDCRYLMAQHQPILLLDLLLARDLSSHKILSGTGLFYDDIVSQSVRMTPQQLRQFVVNADKLDRNGDLSFSWGQQLWPGHYGVMSHALQHSPDLQHALLTLVQYRQQLSPLLVPKLFFDKEYGYVQWLPTLGMGAQHRFMVETMMSALTSFSCEQAGCQLPWEYGFSYPRPSSDEQYMTHFPGALYFGLGVDVMRIKRDWLTLSWSRSSQTAYRVTQRHLIDERDHETPSFIEVVYHCLLEQVQHSLALPDVASLFAMSPATFKRKLTSHGYRFQQLQDEVRLHVSLYWLHGQGWTTEKTAHYLQFSDLANFRRAFRRWCGHTPRESRAILGS